MRKRLVALWSDRSALFASTQVRYLIVGGWNTIFGVALFAILWALLGSVVAYGWILLLAQVVAVLQAHMAQRLVVWRSHGRRWPELLRFSSVYAATYFLNLGLLALCVEVWGMPLLPSQFAITAFLIVVSYTVNRRWTFRL